MNDKTRRIIETRPDIPERLSTALAPLQPGTVALILAELGEGGFPIQHRTSVRTGHRIETTATVGREVCRALGLPCAPFVGPSRLIHTRTGVGFHGESRKARALRMARSA